MARVKREPTGPPVVVDNYTVIHPALDYWQSRNGGGETIYHSITSIGEYFKQEYNTGEIGLYEGVICFWNNGETFPFSQRELAARNLYYGKGLDLPVKRWAYQDMMEFSEEIRSGSASSPTIQESFKKIKSTVEFFMDFDDKRIYDLISTFIIYTYFYPLFHHAPILQLWGEAKTGKTKICNLFSTMAFNPINSANISEATVFRVMEGRRATILLDESEDLMTSDRGRAICNLLLAGHSKSGETFRQEKMVEGDKYKTASYKVFGPKIIANISGVNLIPMFSRCIRMITVGAIDKAKSNRDVSVEDPMFINVRNGLYRMAMTASKYVIKAHENMPDTSYQGSRLNDRARGIWEGLLTIASMVEDKTVWEGLLQYAHENHKAMQEEIDASSSGTALLKQLFLLTEEYGDDSYRPAQIMDFCARNEELEIHGKREICNLMKKLGYKSKTRREGSQTYRSYELVGADLLQKLRRS